MKTKIAVRKSAKPSAPTPPARKASGAKTPKPKVSRRRSSKELAISKPLNSPSAARKGAKSPAAPTATFQAGYVQFDIKRGNIRANLRAALRGLQNLADADVKLAVLPEMWTSGMVAGELSRMVEESDAALQEIRHFAQQHAMVVIGSSYERVGKSIFNTARVIDADGLLVGNYRKIHLFTPGDEHKHFAEGDMPLLVSTAVGRIGVTICYDLRFPELFRGLCEAGADLITVSAQWPTARQEHWTTLLRARAIENQVHVIAANRTGVDERIPGKPLVFSGGSVIFDPWGRELVTHRSRAAAGSARVDAGERHAARKNIPVWSDRRPKAYRFRT
jgi:omega-amidase